MDQELVEQIVDLSSKAARSCVAIVDTIAARGGFRGEELTTVGQLRDQLLTLVQLCEEAQSSADSDGEE